VSLPPELALEALRRSDEAVIVVDADGSIVFVNETAESMFGYDADELQGNKVEVLVPESFRQSHERLRRPHGDELPSRHLLSGLSFQARKKNGDLFEAEIALAPLQTNTGQFVCSTVRAVGDRKASAAYFRNLLESAPDAMIIVDADGAIEFVNRQCEHMFGYSRAELIGLSVDELIPQRLRGSHHRHRENFVAEPRIRPMGEGRELAGLRKDGTEFPVEISLSPVEGPGGLRVSSVIRDVTVRKKLESELIEARHEAERANRANTAFLTAASHDLRQPVQALSLLNGALRRTVSDPRAIEMVVSQQQSLDAMTNLLNSLLDISRLDRGVIEPEIEDFPIQRLIDRLSAEFGRQAKQKNVVFFSRECPSVVRSDPNLLAEIIQNLVSNAIRYTEPGGRVTISADPEDDRLRIDVRDTGIGIDPEEFEEIFTEFHQARRQSGNKEGFGLGLAIVRRLADLLDAEVRVDSELDRGSCFSVLVPRRDDADADLTEDEQESPDTGAGSGARVLLVEDDPSVAAAWSLLLGAEGFEDLMRGQSAAPDVVISDYHLADESTGVEVIRRVRERYRVEVPAFIVSGDTSQVVDEARDMPNSLLMRKPVNTELLLRLAQEAAATRAIRED